MVGELLEGIKEHQPIVIDSRFNNSTHSLNERIRKPGKDCEALDVFYDYFSKNYHAYTALSNGFVVYQPNG